MNCFGKGQGLAIAILGLFLGASAISDANALAQYQRIKIYGIFPCETCDGSGCGRGDDCNCFDPAQACEGCHGSGQVHYQVCYGYAE